MADHSPDVEKKIASLVEVADALLRGEFKKNVEVDAEGILSEQAQKINAMVINMQTVEVPLSSAGNQAPSMSNRAKNVVELMRQTAGDVLDKSDTLSDLADELEAKLEENTEDSNKKARKSLTSMKEIIYDVIATQTYQDVARQKLEKIVRDLDQMRDWLIEALLILNIHKNDSPENIQKKTEQLREMSDAESSENCKQDLVDELLSEFGF